MASWKIELQGLHNECVWRESGFRAKQNANILLDKQVCRNNEFCINEKVGVINGEIAN